ncbi:MAG: cupin domain-containing protein [bacterium]
MSESVGARAAVHVPAGQDRLDERRGPGIRALHFKTCSRDGDDLFVIESTFHAKGGPPRHLHHDQDEWFYVVEGEFLFEVGPDRWRLAPGDSLLAPRRIPHVWACVGDGHGRILIAFTPAGKMEAFFREGTKVDAMPPHDPVFWHAHGMELLGPPLAVG